MRRIYVALAVLSMLLGFSCSRQEHDVQLPGDEIVGKLLTFKASFGDTDETKSVFISNETSNSWPVYWTPGDAINIFYGGRSGARFETSEEFTTAGPSAEFVGYLQAATGTSDDSGGTTTQNFWAVYPYDENNTCDGSSVTLTIPSEQTGVAGTFANNLNPTVAMSPNLGLSFYNVGSWFIFTLTQENVISATLEGADGETLVGKVKVSMDNNNRPCIDEVTDGKTLISMTPEGGSFQTGQFYCMVILPGTYNNGLILSLTKQDGSKATCEVKRQDGNPMVIERSRWARKKKADEGLVYSRPNNVIYYTSTDGIIVNPNYSYISTDERMFGASIISNTYSNGKGIITFDKDVTMIGQYAFANRSTLASISLPESITSIGQEAFEGTSLSSIRIPENVVRIDAGAFAICPSLAEFSGKFATEDGRCLVIDDKLYAFAANGITDYVIPSNVTTIIGFTFAYCRNLTSISLPSDLGMIQDYAFYNCSGIKTVDFPSRLHTINSYSFWGCQALISITLPYNMTFIGESAFASSGVSRVRIEAITPPEGGSGMFNSSCSVFVPSQAVNAYQSTQYWRDYSIIDDTFWGY